MAVLRARSKSAWALASLLAGSACGYEGGLPTPTRPPGSATQAQIGLSLSSSPVNAVVAANGGASWTAAWTVTVQETAGLGGNILSVGATLTDSTGAPIAETTLDAEQLTAQMGGNNHIRGGSRQDIPTSLTFDFPADAVSGDLRVTVQFSDDRGNTVAAAIDDVVQVCVPSLLAPDEGAIMDNGCTNRDNGILWEFDWSDCQGAEAYEFFLDHPSVERPVEEAALTESSFTLLEDRVIPEGSRFGWTWRVRAQLNGVWGDWSPERRFDVEPVNTDCVTP